MKTIDYAAVIERIKKIKKFKNDVMLAEFWDVSRQAIHGFKKNKVPLEMLIEFCVSENISLDWLILDRGDPAPTEPQKSIDERLAKIEKILKGKK